MSEQRLSEIRAWLNGETPQLPGGIADVRWLLDQLLATRDVLEAAVNNERGWWTKAARILAVREAVSADTPEECPIHGCSIRVTGRCGVCIAEGRYDEGGSVSVVGGEGT